VDIINIIAEIYEKENKTEKTQTHGLFFGNVNTNDKSLVTRKKGKRHKL
jgi:hypothetical protein